MSRKKTLLSWSTGKDSAWALHVLRQDPSIEVVGLFATVNNRYNRVSMHASSLDMLVRQSEAVGLSVETLLLTDPCPNETYERIMGRFVDVCKKRGVVCMAFGDLFLDEVREYREQRLMRAGIEPLFPLWGMPSMDLAETMLSSGLEAYVSCVSLGVLDAGVVGRRWSMDMIHSLPSGCDPCGENGEFHTVVVDGPMFSCRIPADVGEVVVRDGFAYADIVPRGSHDQDKREKGKRQRTPSS